MTAALPLASTPLSKRAPGPGATASSLSSPVPARPRGAIWKPQPSATVFFPGAPSEHTGRPEPFHRKAARVGSERDQNGRSEGEPHARMRVRFRPSGSVTSGRGAVQAARSGEASSARRAGMNETSPAPARRAPGQGGVTSIEAATERRIAAQWPGKP
jgi:hypothetical protein